MRIRTQIASKMGSRSIVMASRGRRRESKRVMRRAMRRGIREGTRRGFRWGNEVRQHEVVVWRYEAMAKALFQARFIRMPRI
jgi:hypothetical protein